MNKNIFDALNYSRPKYTTSDKKTLKTAQKALFDPSNHTFGFKHSVSSMVNFLTALPASASASIPTFEIIIDERKLNALNEDLPRSGKVYRSARLKTGGETYNVNVKYRGDNAYHWSGDFKSWGIKFQKNDRFFGYRYLNLINPRSITGLEMFAGYHLARQFDLITPPYFYGRLFVNGRYLGVVQTVFKPSEAVLRANRLMPGDLYNIEPAGNWKNASSWQKRASSNYFPSEDRQAFQRFLNMLQTLLHQSDYSADLFDQFSHVAHIDKMIDRWNVQTIARSRHQDETHNQQWYIDPLTGRAEPICWDVWGYGQMGDSANIMHPLTTPHLAMLRFGHLVSQKNVRLYQYVKKDQKEQKQKEYITELWNSVKDAFASSPIVDKGYMTGRPWRALSVPRFELKKDADKIIHFPEQQYKQDLVAASINMIEAIHAKADKSYSIGLKGHVGAQMLFFTVDSHNGPKQLQLNFQDKRKVMLRQDPLHKNRYIPEQNIFIHPSFALGNNHQQLYVLMGRSFFKALPFININTIIFQNLADKSMQSIAVKKMAKHPTNPLGHDVAQSLETCDRVNVPCLWTYPSTLLEIEKKPKTIVFGPGEVTFRKNRVFRETETVKFLPGTIVKLAKNVSLIFYGQFFSQGRANQPVVFKSIKQKPAAHDQWQVIALVGKGSSGSEIKYTHFIGGKGGVVNDVYYTGATNILHTNDIQIRHSRFMNNTLPSDDTLHVAQSHDVMIQSSEFLDGSADGLDVDISTVSLINNLFLNNANDGLDLMESKATVVANRIFKSGDKGISTGENSELVAYNNFLKDNPICIAVKDHSVGQISLNTFHDCKVDISAYKKSLYYPSGGVVKFMEDNIVVKASEVVERNTLVDIYSCINEACVEPTGNIRKSIKNVLQQRYESIQNVDGT